jgi:hypothetical protein
MPGGFTDDFQRPHYRKIGSPVDGKSWEIHAPNKPQGLIGSL